MVEEEKDAGGQVDLGKVTGSKAPCHGLVPFSRSLISKLFFSRIICPGLFTIHALLLVTRRTRVSSLRLFSYVNLNAFLPASLSSYHGTWDKVFAHSQDPRDTAGVGKKIL